MVAPSAAIVMQHHPGPGKHQVRRTIACNKTPVAAYRSVVDLGAALLESRTQHPGARTSYIAVRPTLSIYADAKSAYLSAGDSTWTRLDGAAWPRLCEILEADRELTPDGHGFDGGWVGVLSHEASSWILGLEPAPPQPPARPAFSWADFGRYEDCVRFDQAGKCTIIARGATMAQARRHARVLEDRLTAPDAAAAPLPAAAPTAVATMDDNRFLAAVDHAKQLIRSGDCFQVNLTASFAYPWLARPSSEQLISLYDAYAAGNPGPWSGYYEGRGFSVLSASPELLLDVTGSSVRLRPVAGTRGRGTTPAEDDAMANELRQDTKEQAEHAMLVDLARNDAVQLCRPGSVHAPALAAVERFRHVMHLVSRVEGELDGRPTIRQMLEAVFPGGTVTGAPKRRAVQRVAQIEGAARGPYTGALGYVAFGGDVQWNLLIRTLVATPTHIVAHAGCGIVEGSGPRRELAELEAKARAQVDAIAQRGGASTIFEVGQVDGSPSWRPTWPARGTGRRVLVVDFEDSFVHNLADGFRAAGAAVKVVGATQHPQAAWRWRPTHLVLSPGPGAPSDFPSGRAHLDLAFRRGIPVLGVCLGHQILVEALGGSVVTHPDTVHGRASRVQRTPEAADDLVLGPWSGRRAARYHSLVAKDLAAHGRVLAHLDDGTPMAVAADDRPWWGLQFHPESVLTENGGQLLQAFLDVGAVK